MIKLTFFNHYFSPINIFMKKERGSASWSVLVTNGSGCGSGTLVKNNLLTSTKQCSGWIRDILRQNRTLYTRLRTIRIRLWIRILLSLSVASKMSTKNTFFCLLLSVVTFTWAFKDNKILRSHKTVELKSRFFLIFGLTMEGSESGSWKPKKERIQIRNTG
jgi:hypothetical protein